MENTVQGNENKTANKGEHKMARYEVRRLVLLTVWVEAASPEAAENFMVDYGDECGAVGRWDEDVEANEADDPYCNFIVESDDDDEVISFKKCEE
jgi:hypothetical protein